MIVWSWGANSYGQLGLGHCDDQLLPQPLVEFPENVSVASGGGGHTLFVTDCGQLFACGSNNKGQLGLNSTDDFHVLTRVSTPVGIRVVMATAGWDFTLIVTETNKLYVCGSNAFGQLGDPSLASKNTVPTEICGDLQFQQVAAGLRHSVALTVSGDVYCWGHAKRGQCAVLTDGNPPLKVVSPEKVTFPDGSGKMVQVVAGSYHTAALSDNGEVYIWGCNKYGQCTLDPEVSSQVSAPCKVSEQLFQGQKVKVLQTGWTHFMAQTDTGIIYSWGRGDYGQLGRSLPQGTTFSYIPAPVDTKIQVHSFVCGSEHTLFLSDGGNVYAVGWNEHGLCATGDEVNVVTVTLVRSLENRTVLCIGCGGGHCFAITQDTENG